MADDERESQDSVGAPASSEILPPRMPWRETSCRLILPEEETSDDLLDRSDRV
jgi:hypothetical protein